jgi:long-chain acyl-CoA synthetase
MVTVDLKAIYDKLAAVAPRTSLKRIVVCSFAMALPPLKDLAFRSLKAKDIARVADDALNVLYAKLVADRAPPSLPRLSPTDIAVIQYTGGTTGVAKGATLTHANLTANCAQVLRHIGANQERERILGVLPLFHVFALTSVLNYGIAVGAELILLPRFELADTLRTIRQRRPTNFPAVPTIYNAINTAPAKLRQDLGSLTHCVSGGAPLPLEVKAAFERLTGCTVVEGYGLSETSPVLCVNPLDGRAKAGSVGPPVTATTIEIRDPEAPGRLMPQGERGEVCARGPQVMGGYWNKPAETKAAFIDGAFRTGDVGYLDADGFLFLVDRLKDLILCGGYNVYPRVIEEALYRHPAVREATVIGVPDAYRGEAPKAFVALREGMSATPEELKAFLGGEISKIEMPREIELRDSLPRTLVGKLSKKELEAEEEARREAAV